MRVKPPSSILRSSSIRHENQEDTFLPFFLHASVTAGPSHAPRTYSAISTGTFSALESEPRQCRTEPDATEGAPSEVRVSPACAVGYNAPQDGKYDVEAGNGGAGARCRFRVTWHLRTDNLPEQVGHGASRPVRLCQFRLSRIGAGTARQRPKRPQQPGFRWQRNSL
jgi:hypothetical protein